MCEIYAHSLNRDPAFKDYLTRIGELYFGIRPPQTNRGFGDILSNLFQSFAEDNDEEMREDLGETSRTQSRPTLSQPIGGEDLD